MDFKIVGINVTNARSTEFLPPPGHILFGGQISRAVGTGEPAIVPDYSNVTFPLARS